MNKGALPVFQVASRIATLAPTTDSLTSSDESDRGREDRGSSGLARHRGGERRGELYCIRQVGVYGPPS